MNPRFNQDMPNTPDELLAEAIKRDIWERLETAMMEDDVVSEFLNNSRATVVFDVVIDRDADEEFEAGPLQFRGEQRDDVPFAASIGQPAVAAMVASMRKRIGKAEATTQAVPDEPFFFEIAVHPEPIMPLGA